MIYVAIFALLFMISLCEINFAIDRKNRLFICCLFFLTVFIGGRFNNGADYERYQAIFTVIEVSNFWRFDDPGFSGIALGLKTVGFSPYFTFLVFAAIQVCLIGYCIVKNSKYRFPALLVYYSLYMFPFGFNAIAQGISVGIMLCSIKAIEKKKLIKVVIMGVLAVAFHRIGLLIFMLYIIYNMKITRKKLVCFSIVLFFAACFVNYCFVNNRLTTLLPRAFQEIIHSYNSQYVEPVGISSILARVIMLVFVSFMAKQYDMAERRAYLVYLTGFAGFLCLAANDLLATKINLSIKIIEIILVCATLNKVKDRETRSIMLMTLSVFLFTVVASSVRHPDLYPYHSWIFGC
ncbi:EpsG family protein [Acetatifactor muris]|jgi:hypothetical protein|uniref:EpsG family protein n=1 Tax=Acetatifactor muris TaxID=879566 RepID=A0A2K4ZD38_9FIRM|nr:EpsG family protein [Acetatifactor muris]MCR2046767.1 EpsG family protein [Acetatifactor muris]SOY28361.1 hypothetical protein AMURIS_01068 [Acetatifactor muris]